MVKTYPLNKIIEIYKEFVKYLDDDNCIKEFSLLECSENWVNYFNNNINDYCNWDGSQVKEISLENNKCVGERDCFADKPFFIFFTNEKIKFEILPKKRFINIFNRNWKKRYHKEFHKISIKLNNAGWSTFDLG